MRACSELMSLFVRLIENDFRTAPVAMWSETFSAWAAATNRRDRESISQLPEYEEFLRKSIVHLIELRDACKSPQESRAAETVLQEIFGHVARLIAFAEGRSASGMLPRDAESAVLDRDILVQLLGDQSSKLLDDAIQRECQGGS